MATTSESSLTFGELARLVIEKEKKPLTVDEIWAVAEQTGLVSQLKGTGKRRRLLLEQGSTPTRTCPMVSFRYSGSTRARTTASSSRCGSSRSGRAERWAKRMMEYHQADHFQRSVG